MEAPFKLSAGISTAPWSAATVAAAAAAVAGRTQGQHVTLAIIFVQVVDRQAAALKQDVARLAVHQKLNPAVVYDFVVILWLIQSHADTRPTSAETLDEEADSLALVFIPIESAKGLAGAGRNADQIGVVHDHLPLSYKMAARLRPAAMLTEPVSARKQVHRHNSLSTKNETYF